MQSLSRQITQLDSVHSAQPSPDTYRKRLSLQAEFDVLSSAHVEDLLLKSRYNYYEHGDKTSKLLAHQLKQTSASHQIPQIRTPTGVTRDPKQINEQFEQFYTSLYTSEQSSDPSAYEDFFSTLDIPKLSTYIALTSY